MGSGTMSRHSRGRRTATALVGLGTALVVLAGCGGDDDDASVPLPTGPIEVSSSETPTGGATEGSTVTSAPAPTDDTDGTGGTGGTAAPDPATGALPTDAQSYAQALIDAWQAGDRAAADRLGDPDEVEDLFEEDDLRGTPAFVSCEGAAGSSYCTWQGTGNEGAWTVQVRVGNEAVSQGQERAVTEIEVED